MKFILNINKKFIIMFFLFSSILTPVNASSVGECLKKFFIFQTYQKIIPTDTETEQEVPSNYSQSSSTSLEFSKKFYGNKIINDAMQTDDTFNIIEVLNEWAEINLNDLEFSHEYFENIDDKFKNKEYENLFAFKKLIDKTNYYFNERLNLQNIFIIAATYGLANVVDDILKMKLTFYENKIITETDLELALRLASHNGHLEIVKSLLKNNVNVKATDRDGNTALMLASKRKLTYVKTLLRKAEA